MYKSIMPVTERKTAGFLSSALGLGFCGGRATLAGLLSWAAVAARSTDLPSASVRDIVVTVIDAEARAPLADVSVFARVQGPLGMVGITNQVRARTDHTGSTLVRAELPDKAWSFQLTVEHTNYPARHVSWHSQQGRIKEIVPTNYNVALARGITVGGVVRDEQGMAVGGVTVIPWGNSMSEVTASPDPRAGREYSAELRQEGNVITDTNGFWQRKSFPADVATVLVDVVRPGGARSFFTTAAARQRGWETADQVSLSDLRSTNAVLIIKPGVTVRGVAVDQHGKPLGNVQLRERVGSSHQLPIYTFTNRVDGGFELPHRATNRQYVITAERPGFATKSVVFMPTQDGPELRIALSPAQPLRLRVTGDTKEPVGGATVSIQEWRMRDHVLSWSATTDAEGRVAWTNAPEGTIELWITPTNYPARAAKLASREEEHEIRVRRGSDEAIEIQVKAFAAESGLPLKQFELWRRLGWGEGFHVWQTNLGEGIRATLRKDDFAQGQQNFAFQVRAEGRAPWKTEDLLFHEGDREFSVTLTNASPPGGLVLQPDGRPASDAKVLLSTDQNSIFVNRPGEFYAGRGLVSQKTGSDGVFQFDFAEDNWPIVVSHLAGFASLTTGELRRSKEVRLQPWARIDGTLLPGGKPKAHEHVNLKSPISWQDLPGHHLVFSARTDTEGRFLFTNLPPGDYVLYRQPHIIYGTSTTESHRQIFDLKGGEVKKLDYGLGGRTVIGRVETSVPVNWQNDPHVLAAKTPPAPEEPNYYSYVNVEDFNKARAAFGKSAALREHERRRQQFQLVFDRDGNFQVDDVPEGTYELRLRVTKPPENPRAHRFEGNEVVLGTLVQEVKIPRGAPGEEFDLATFELEVKGVDPISAPVVNFQLTPLEPGVPPFDLASLRGQPVLVVFWAEWAPQSVALLKGLQTMRANLASDETIALVTVNFDEDSAAARSAVRELTRGWQHGRLDGADRATVTERLGVNALPTTLLLDAEGRAAGRDFVVKRLPAAVKRLSQKQATK